MSSVKNYYDFSGSESLFLPSLSPVENRVQYYGTINTCQLTIFNYWENYVGNDKYTGSY